MSTTFFRSITLPQLLIVLGIAIWWLVPLLMIGVFDDGMFYSSISRNLIYDPQATIWDLKVSNALDNSFNGHPPMFFWIESLFFGILGDYFWIERIFSLCTALISIYLIHLCWKIFSKESSSFAILFWLCVPIVGWSYGNNMLENVLVLFTTAAIWLILRQAVSGNNWITTIFISSLLIFGAVLTKGPVGLFPLATWAIYALVIDKKQLPKALIGSLLISALVLFYFALLFYFSERALAFFQRYFQLQVASSLAGMDSLAAHRFFLLQAIAEELLIVLIIISLAKVLSSNYILKLKIISKTNWKVTFFWLLIALSASLPMLISPKQLRFYIVPSTLFFSLSLATMALPIFEAISIYFNKQVLAKRAGKAVVTTAIIACLVLSYNNTNKFARSFDVLPDSFILGEHIPSHTEAFLHANLYTVWNLHAYMYRYFYIDLSTVYKEQPYAIFPKDLPFESADYQEKEVGLKNHRLYERVH